MRYLTTLMFRQRFNDMIEIQRGKFSIVLSGYKMRKMLVITQRHSVLREFVMLTYKLELLFLG